MKYMKGSVLLALLLLLGFGGVAEAHGMYCQGEASSERPRRGRNRDDRATITLRCRGRRTLSDGEGLGFGNTMPPPSSRSPSR